MAPLTRTQKRIIDEIDEIAADIGISHHAIVEEFEGSDSLTELLTFARRRLIIATIVTDYTFFEEMLGSIIARYYFGARPFSQLWRTKRFKRFNHYVLERLYLLQKLALVKEILPVPKAVSSYLERLNDLRNAVAHAFFPENLRGSRTSYDGVDIFTMDGYKRLRKDGEPVFEFLASRGLR
jgi:hypothetical protein